MTRDGPPTPGASQAASDTLRFGVFEIDFRAGVLRKRGRPVRLRPQVWRTLTMLARRPGELVSRDELRREIWGDDTFVDFEHGLNFCIRQLRIALGDAARQPRYLETVARRGYRFIAPIDQPVATTLAVLPFANAAGAPEVEYVADGLTEAVIRTLAQHATLRVLARGTVFRYKGRTPDLALMRRTLRASHVVTGEVRTSADGLDVRVELIETASGRHLWSHHYEGPPDSLMGVESAMCASIAHALRIPMPGVGGFQPSTGHPARLDAYHLYMKGRYFFHQWSGEGFREAVACFRQAVELDPAYALGYAGLSDCFGALGFYGYAAAKVIWPLAKQAAQRALEIDDGLGEAHASLTLVRLWFDWDWPGADASSRGAIALAPGSPVGYQYRGLYLLAVCRVEEAVREMEHGLLLDPLSPFAHTFLGIAAHLGRDYAKATEVLETALELDPRFGEARRMLGITYVQTGRLDEAIEQLEAAAPLLGHSPSVLGSLGRAYGRAGRTADLNAVIARLQALASAQEVGAASLASVCVATGDLEAALDWLERGCEARVSWLAWLDVDPWWDPLRPHPRFQAILRRVGLPSA